LNSIETHLVVELWWHPCCVWHQLKTARKLQSRAKKHLCLTPRLSMFAKKVTMFIRNLPPGHVKNSVYPSCWLMRWEVISPSFVVHIRQMALVFCIILYTSHVYLLVIYLHQTCLYTYIIVFIYIYIHSYHMYSTSCLHHYWYHSGHTCGFI
jgi:hypothetical protein